MFEKKTICKDCERVVVKEAVKTRREAKLSFIHACELCKHTSLSLHNKERALFHLRVLPAETLEEWQDTMLLDFKRQMRGEPPLSIQDPGLKEEAPKSPRVKGRLFRFIRVEGDSK